MSSEGSACTQEATKAETSMSELSTGTTGREPGASGDRSNDGQARPPETKLGPIETQLAAIWEGVLGRSIGVRDNFFDLGGDRRLARRLLIDIEERFGRKLSWDALIAHPPPSHRARDHRHGDRKPRDRDNPPPA